MYICRDNQNKIAMDKLFEAEVLRSKSNKLNGLPSGSYLLSTARTVMVRPEGENTLLRYRVKDASDVNPQPLVVQGAYPTVAARVAERDAAYSSVGFPVVVKRGNEDEEMLVNFADVVCVCVDSEDKGELVVSPLAGRQVRYEMAEPVTDFKKTFAGDNADLLVARGLANDSSLGGVPLVAPTTTNDGTTVAKSIPLTVTVPKADASAVVFIPWTRNPNATVKAYAGETGDNGSGTFLAIAESYDFSTTNVMLRIEVTGKDGTTKKYYKLTVTVPA